jgi:hypothetical protein|tara:strand:+ start:119 stop:469 length:351 start_codon:yes stop_codon:yes gene_type:complete
MEKEDFKNIQALLNGAPDDYEIALSNIKNMKPHEIFILLLGKDLVSEKRANFIKEFPAINWPEGKDFTYRALYKRCKNMPPKVQEVFTDIISRQIYNGYLCETFEFVEELKIEIKW